MTFEHEEWFNPYDCCDTETNAQKRKKLQRQYGDKLIKYAGNYYEKGGQPVEGQSEPRSLQDGTPIRFIAWFMDDC